MKKIIYIAALFCYFKFNTNLSASETNISAIKQVEDRTLSFDKYRYFPEDTVIRFINKYGKDSLAKLIDKRISNAEEYILKNYDKIKYDNTTLEYILVAGHFKLNIDYKLIDTFNFTGKQLRLYDLSFGNLQETIRIIDAIRASGRNMIDTLMSQSIESIRYAVPLYCEKLTLNNEVYYLILDNSKKASVNVQIKDYWIFAELNRRCKDESNGSITYQETLFKELFPRNNPKAFYLDAFPAIGIRDSSTANSFYQTPKEKELDIFYDKYSPLRMLAYALYANDVNMTNYSDNLIYLLDAQQENGSWSLAKKFNHFNSDPTSTIYGFWSLCEFKSKLLNNK